MDSSEAGTAIRSGISRSSGGGTVTVGVGVGVGSGVVSVRVGVGVGVVELSDGDGELVSVPLVSPAAATAPGVPWAGIRLTTRATTTAAAAATAPRTAFSPRTGPHRPAWCALCSRRRLADPADDGVLLQPATPFRHEHRLGPGARTGLAHRRAQVVADRSVAEHEQPRDVGHGAAVP